jgi:hypothetical protein
MGDRIKVNLLNRLKRAAAIGISFALVLSGTAVNPAGDLWAATADVHNPEKSIAATTTSTSASTSLSISKTATESNADNRYKITFAIPDPGKEEDITTDVVLVVDKTTLYKADRTWDTYRKFASEAKTMLDQMQTAIDRGNGHVHFNVGIISYSYRVLDESTKGLLDVKTKRAEIENSLSQKKSTHTSVEVGIRNGYDWLKNDTSVDNTNKYLIIMSDYGGYSIADEGDTDGLFRYAEDRGFLGQEDFDLKYGTPAPVTQSFRTDMSNITKTNFQDIDDLITKKKLLSGVTANSTFMDGIGETVSEFYDQDNPDGKSYYSSKPKGKITLDDIAKADMPTMYEKSIYRIGNLLKDIKKSGVSVYSITQDYYPGLNIFYPNEGFQCWINANIGPVFNLTEGQDMGDIFSTIRNNIFMELSSGTLTDVIGSHYSFAKDTSSYIIPEVTENGTLLPCKTITENSDWGYGTYDENTKLYPYEVMYDASSKMFTWKINVTTLKTEKLSFSYYVDRDDDETLKSALGEGTHKLDTNKSASIAYNKSDETGAYHHTVSLNSPYTWFNYFKGGFTVQKSWSDGADAHVSDSVAVDVTKDGSSFATLTLNASTEKKWTAEVGLSTVSDASPSNAAAVIAGTASPADPDEVLKDGIVEGKQNFKYDTSDYTIAEQKVNGYTAGYAFESNTRVLTITNTKDSGTNPGGNPGSSGSSGGSSGTTPTTRITDSAVPQGDSGLATEDIDGTRIDDAEIPLGGMPKTGEERNLFGMILLSAGAVLVMLTLSDRKKETRGK